ncbi:MAG: glycosyl hydrolase family 18 protein, partial [Phycisphaerales bacterium]
MFVGAVGAEVVGHRDEADVVAETLLHRGHQIDRRHREELADSVELGDLGEDLDRLRPGKVQMGVEDRPAGRKRLGLGAVVQTEAIRRVSKGSGRGGAGRSSWDATRPNWTAFVAELGAALRAQGKLLSVTIPGPCSVQNICGGRNGYWVYNLEGIAPHADRIRIMAYDYTVQSIGPIAPIDWVRANVEYAITVMDPGKLQIGVPTYGRARTRKKGGDFWLSGVCPSRNGSSAERRAYRSATSMAAVTAADIPGLLTTYGLTDADVRWDPVRQESSFRYTKE